MICGVPVVPKVRAGGVGTPDRLDFGNIRLYPAAMTPNQFPVPVALDVFTACVADAAAMLARLATTLDGNPALEAALGVRRDDAARLVRFLHKLQLAAEAAAKSA